MADVLLSSIVGSSLYEPPAVQLARWIAFDGAQSAWVKLSATTSVRTTSITAANRSVLSSELVFSAATPVANVYTTAVDVTVSDGHIIELSSVLLMPRDIDAGTNSSSSAAIIITLDGVVAKYTRLTNSSSAVGYGPGFVAEIAQTTGNLAQSPNVGSSGGPVFYGTGINYPDGQYAAVGYIARSMLLPAQMAIWNKRCIIGTKSLKVEYGPSSGPFTAPKQTCIVGYRIL